MRFRSALHRPSPRAAVTHRNLSHKKHVFFSAKRIVILVVTIVFVLYVLVVLAWYQHGEASSSARAVVSPNQLLRNNNNANSGQQHREEQIKKDALGGGVKLDPFAMKYKDWRELAVKLASLSAVEALEALEELDPFGTRQFEKSLVYEESRLKRLLTMEEIKYLFPCPKDRISLPDQRNATKAQDFRGGHDGETFLFFQHLRKAGGTHFCSMAETNLPRNAVPRYYCMPDMGWSGNKGAGYLHHWSNAEIVTRMKAKGHRVLGNEWDNFDVQNHFDLPAVFATSFRRPLDRALSQFRFECVEDRGCKIKDIGQWWKKRKDLYNVFVCTFSDGDCQKEVYEGTSKQDGDKRGQLLGAALDTVAKFNLVLVMEWLSYAGPQVQSVLGFQDTSVLTKRVRPHIQQANRDDGQQENKLGAAGIAKASWVPKDYLTPNQYREMSHSLALDEILTDAARRMFLERLVC